jgi:hypothetical protein
MRVLRLKICGGWVCDRTPHGRYCGDNGLRRGLYFYWLGQNGHDFVGSAGGDGLAPVVGFGVAALVQDANGGLYSGECAK